MNLQQPHKLPSKRQVSAEIYISPSSYIKHSSTNLQLWLQLLLVLLPGQCTHSAYLWIPWQFLATWTVHLIPQLLVHSLLHNSVHPSTKLCRMYSTASRQDLPLPDDYTQPYVPAQRTCKQLHFTSKRVQIKRHMQQSVYCVWWRLTVPWNSEIIRLTA